MQSLDSFIFKLNIFTVPPLVVGILMFVLGLITMIKDKASKVSISFFMVTLSIFVWLASLAWIYSAPNEQDALFWAIIQHFGVAFIPSFFFIFTLDIIRRYRQYKHFAWATLGLSGLFCVGFVFSPYLIESVSLQQWGYYALYGSLGFTLIVYVGLFMMISIALLWSDYIGSTSERERSRLKGIFLGAAIGLFGTIDFAPALGVAIYPLGYIPIFICALILGQTILRFRLIDLTPSFAAKHILETTEGPIAVIDLEENLCVVNRSLCELLGYNEKELKDQKVSLLFDVSGDVFPSKLNKDWVLHAREMEWKKKDDTTVDMSVSASTITDKDGTPAGIVYAATDITERKKAEEELKQAKETAERANQAKSEFLANMSHEIRTPLNAVIGFSDILSDTTLNELQIDYIDTIRESGKLLLALINDILDFSKIEARQIELEEIDFNMKNLVEDILKIARPKVSHAKIELYHHFDEAMPENFKGDPTRIRQILLNLLNNAIKFTEKGEIGVRVSPAKSEPISSKAGKSIYPIQISVKDTGVGIPKDKQKLIFETFTQADTSITREYGGTGLGLAITSALVEKMGGKIWVESEEGKGSEFFIILKLKESDLLDRADITPLESEELKGKEVFIVDDNDNARRLLSSYCLNAGLKVRAIIPLAIEAWERLETEKDLPDLIISDIMMPKMDGYQFAQKIKSQSKFKGIKLVAVSSDAKPGSARIAKESGFDAFMTKPARERAFINVLKTVLGDTRKDGQIVTTHMAEELSAKRIRVLVAEDNAVNQKLIRILLQRLGCVEEIVPNGKIAFEKATTEEYDLCLMDLQMPVMGGIEATKNIRKSGNTKLPIIALTAVAFKEGRDECLEAGMNDFLARPVDPDKLKEKILEWTKEKT
jgi:two-component system sensor histidine kinase/response regulator